MVLITSVYSQNMHKPNRGFNDFLLFFRNWIWWARIDGEDHEHYARSEAFLLFRIIEEKS